MANFARTNAGMCSWWMVGMAVMSTALTKGVHAETCGDAWAHSPDKNICAPEIGADYWGWTNGRYGTSGCDACDCPDCPTVAPAPTKAPTPTPVPLPQKCVGISASWSGDPHFTTFDGLKYDCQGEGEFHVLRSLDSGFEIQGRFVKFRSGKRPTVTKSVAWKTGDGEPLIQVTVPDNPVGGSCMPWVHVNKVKTDVLTSDWIDDSFAVQVALEERFDKQFQGYVFYYTNSGVQVTVLAKKSSANGCVLSVKYCLPNSWERSKENFVGLLGTPDGDKTNDWMDRDGNPVPVPTKKKDLKFRKSYDWCVPNFCIRQASDSLFAYESGESYDGFNECDLPPDTETEQCVDTGGDAETGDLTGICAAEDFECLIDGCVGGEAEAKSFLTTVSALGKDGDCGKELLFEDFDGPDAAEWGEIQQGNLESKFLFLDRYNNIINHKVDVPIGAHEVKIEFIFYEIGFWEGDKRKSYAEFVYLTVGSTKLDLTGFDQKRNRRNVEEYFKGVKNGITWSRRAITSYDDDLGFWWIQNNNPNFDKSSTRDQIHKIEVTVPHELLQSGELEIGFEVDINGGYNDERAGVDDLRITAYGATCDIPGENGILYQDGCGEQLVFQDLEDNDAHAWGTVETHNSQSYLKLTAPHGMLQVSGLTFPNSVDVVVLEFYVYELGDWATACGDRCADNKLLVTIGSPGVAVPIGTFENGLGDATQSEGVVNGINWYRHHIAGGVLKVDMHIPASLFVGNEVAFEMLLTVGVDGLAAGIDEVRVLAYNNDCKLPSARRRLLDLMVPPTSVQKPRFLSPAVEYDTCTCICPALDGVPSPSPTSSSAPKVLDLYLGQSSATCDPEGVKIGTVSLTINSDGAVTAVYDVFQPEKYDIKETAVYVGEERLPGVEVGNILTHSSFPYTSSSEVQVNMDPLVCDFYVAAYAKICGDVPTQAPTQAPTGTPTSHPTQAPTQATQAPTQAPTGTPTSHPTPTPPAPTPGSFGDPHVKTWSGDLFDFHGGCDLVLLDNPSFHNGLGMKIHIRTEIHTWWSYIATAVISIGGETLEVQGGKDQRYLVNGKEGDPKAKNFLFSELGLKVLVKRATDHQVSFRVDLLNADAIRFEVYNDFVRVNIKETDPKWKKFAGSVGLMGSYDNSGETLGRDGVTVFTDMNALGQEWQVREDEPQLFHTVEGPQHPAQCSMPEEVSVEDKRRRLGSSMITKEDAELSCALVADRESRDACVFDVLATNDVGMAGSYLTMD